MYASSYLASFVVVLTVVYVVGRFTAPAPARLWLRPVPLSWGVVAAVCAVFRLLLLTAGVSAVVGLLLLAFAVLGGV